MTKWLVPDKSLDITTQMSQALTPEAATSLASMPVLILRGPKDPEEFWYILPPIKYPDGRWYLKMGYDGNMLNQRLESKEEALNWMKAKQARPELVSVAQQMAARYFPGVTFTGHVSTIVCITDDTHPNGQGQRRPYIDYLDKGVAVASGGNGWAAKSSDHIGWLASEMLSNSSEWATDPVSKALFPKDRWFDPFPSLYIYTIPFCWFWRLFLRKWIALYGNLQLREELLHESLKRDRTIGPGDLQGPWIDVTSAVQCLVEQHSIVVHGSSTSSKAGRLDEGEGAVHVCQDRVDTYISAS
ncbi:unnamed protein product [Durusdinium trenchii]|uniref:Uncharacterized protein n=2 Tax=Durusdinium trenchii TaxID=1381693 RepID=A0ABP0J485_9DINO